MTTPDPAAYGDAIADLYDDWYEDISDVEGTVATITRLADGGPALELGIGTGRIALPLAAAGVEVHGVDASAAMVERMRSKPGGAAIPVQLADFSVDLPAVDGGFTVAFAAFNTFVNLTSIEAMASCLGLLATRLRPGGCLAIESVLPGDDPVPSGVDVRSISADQVVLSAFKLEGRVVTGSLVAVGAGGVRLCPWSVRLTTPDELVALATEAGFELESLDGGWRDEPVNEATTRYVAVFRLRRTTVSLL